MEQKNRSHGKIDNLPPELKRKWKTACWPGIPMKRCQSG